MLALRSANRGLALLKRTMTGFGIARPLAAARGVANAAISRPEPQLAAPQPLQRQPAYLQQLQRSQQQSRGLRAAAAVAQAPAEAAPLQEAVVDVELPTSAESEELLRIRHSCAHIMAMAVQRLHKEARVTIGPWIERGFYYDFDMPTLTDKDLPKIRKEMQRIIKRNLPFVREELVPEEARARIEALGEPYKLEILEDILRRDPAAPITIYHIGNAGDKDHWWDLCAGPHVASTGAISPDAIDLETVAGAYWRGDEARPMLQRIYGTAWETAEQLAAYKKLKEEAARRDHRKLGTQLDLFSISDEGVGGGLVFWHPKGAMVRHLIESHWKELHLQRGYQLLYTPHIAKIDLWKISGHFDFYRESMFNQMEVENEQYQIKPMNCPFHVAIYKNGYHSYRDLPLRWAELGTVYRYERSGTMHGLFRVRGFTQDDAHIFCLRSQIAQEIRGVLDLTQELLGMFGFHKYEINLSTRPEKSVGDDSIWQESEAALVEALNAKGWAYEVDEGGGAFYGPKIDIKIQDSLGRKWQCSTVQLDFNLPERFDMFYVNEEGKKERPIMIHRALLGSIERFMGILIENYAGAFPLWLAPEQIRLLPVNDAVLPYASEVAQRLRAAGIRAEVSGGMSIGKQIRGAETSKIPVMCVVGAREAESGTLAVRTYRDGELGALSVDEVLQRLTAAVQSKSHF